MPRRRNHGKPVTVGALAEQAVAKIVDRDRLRLTRVQIAWARVAPPALRGLVWPTSIHRNMLTLVVRDNQWLHELVYHQDELLRRIRKAAPEAEVTRLRTRVGQVPRWRPPEPPPPDPELHTLANEPSAETQDALASIEDSALQQTIANARMALTDRVMRSR